MNKIENGMLMPKLANRFKVNFKSANGEVIGTALSSQIIKTSTPIAASMKKLPIKGRNIWEFLSSFGLGNNIKFTFEDDVLSSATKELLSMSTSPFIMEIEYLDGTGNPVEKYILEESSIVEISSTDLDYRGSGQINEHVLFKFPSYLVNGENDIEISEDLQYLLNILKDTKLVLPTEKTKRSAIVRTEVVLYSALVFREFLV